MVRKRSALSFVAALVFCLPAAAQGPAGGMLGGMQEQSGDPIQTDRPGIADGSTVIGPHTFQLETGVQREYRSPGHERTLFVPTLLRFGLDRRWEARVETNGYIQDRISGLPGGSDFHSGYAPISIGTKYHFQEGKGAGRPSLGAILRVFPPSGSDGFHSEHVTGDFRLAADWDFAPRLSLNANVGAAAYEDGTGRGFPAALAAATLSYSLGKRLTLFYDFGFQGPEQRAGGKALITDGGAMYLLGKDTQIDFGIGPGVSGDSVPNLFWTAGISHRFR